MAVAMLPMQTWPGHSLPFGPSFNNIYAPPTRPPLPIFTAPAPPVPISAPEPPLPARNTVELTRDRLTTILTYFASLIPSHFSRPVCIVVHGGASMLLNTTFYELAQQQQHLASYSPSNSPHNTLPRRASTRDVDYLHRAFVAEWAALGVTDAGDRLKDCIRKTARKFDLGEDWMNSDPDIALPMAKSESGLEYDPIYNDAVNPNNFVHNTLFTANNLTLVGITLPWAIALKLARYTTFDPSDTCVMLRSGTDKTKVQWTAEGLERYLKAFCWPMGYDNYDTMRLYQLRSRIRHAVDMVTSWAPGEGSSVPIPSQTQAQSQPVATPPPVPPNQNHNQRQRQVFIPPLPGQSQANAGLWPVQHHSQHQPQGQSQISIQPPPQQRPAQSGPSTWTSNAPMQMPVPVLPIPSSQPQPQLQLPGPSISQTQPQMTEFPSQEQDLEDDPRFYPLPRHLRTRNRDREHRPSSTSHINHHPRPPPHPHPSWSWGGYQIQDVSAPPFAVQPAAATHPNPASSSAANLAIQPYPPIRPHSSSHPYTHRPDPAAFERSVADVLAHGRLTYDLSLARHPGGPDAVLAHMNANLDVENERKSKKKNRTKGRKRDRFAKLLSRNQVEGDGVSCDDDDNDHDDHDDDSGDEERGRAGGLRRRERVSTGDWGRVYPDRPQGGEFQMTSRQQQTQPSPPTWHNNPIYAPPRPATQPFGLHHYGSSRLEEQKENLPARTPSPSRDLTRRDRGRSRSRSVSRVRRRPPELVLSPLPQMDTLRIF